MTDLTQKSKFLSYILRHKPEAANLKLDSQGFVPIDDIIANSSISREELREIVQIDAKKRYSIVWDGDRNIDMIRANQGHSTKVELTFKKAVPPVILFHGTSTSLVPQILKQGLLPMNRHHVHLSDDFGTAIAVAGRRKGSSTIIEVHTPAMLKDGVEFFLSENNVWLVTTVKPKYLKEHVC